MPFTEGQLATEIRNALEAGSNDANIDPAAARQQCAEGLAAAIFGAIIGRTTTVTGSSATGGAVTGTGIIQE